MYAFYFQTLLVTNKVTKGMARLFLKDITCAMTSMTAHPSLLSPYDTLMSHVPQVTHYFVSLLAPKLWNDTSPLPPARTHIFSLSTSSTRTLLFY